MRTAPTVSAGGYSNAVGTYTLAVSDATDLRGRLRGRSTTTGTVVVGGSATGTIEYN